MISAEATYLHCPIRGQLRTRQRAADGLTFTEEKRRIDAIRFLLQRAYPADHFGVETRILKFGNAGKSSLRTDFCVYEEPWSNVAKWPDGERLANTVVVAEIKRDNTSKEDALKWQLKPALSLLPDLNAMGVYWDDVEQRFLYREVEGSFATIREAPISKMPRWREGVGSTVLAYSDLVPSADLSGAFDKMEDCLHPYVPDKARRYAILFQLLLAKIWDEVIHVDRQHDGLNIQDFNTMPLTDAAVLERMNGFLGKAVGHYNRFLPDEVGSSFDQFNPEALRRLSQVIAPINILNSKQTVIQSFYMKFAKGLYKWDLAQYFTPHEVVNFIVSATNPQLEHVCDPACGSADFLVSALRSMPISPGQAVEFLTGVDNSRQAVQVSVLNMMLQGDGKTAITENDSLKSHPQFRDAYDVVLCNPPFGTKIMEKRWEVLRNFDMGHTWSSDGGVSLSKTDNVRTSQQTGILFTELCVKLTKPGGRVGIILPNGYLGNASAVYLALREWILRHTRVVAVVAFPRFTFKKSGADVSASVAVLQRRESPLRSAADTEDYPVYFGMVESVGWRAGDKTAKPVYLRDEETGEKLLDEHNNPILDSDFSKVLDEYRRSAVADIYPWILNGYEVPNGGQTETMPIRRIIESMGLVIDPKRYCTKYLGLRSEILRHDHFKVGDVLEQVGAKRFKRQASELYRYVEIGDVRCGSHDFKEMRGWELPGRAKLRADFRDFFIAHVWGCAGKWFVVSDGMQGGMVVTNGCTRFRIKDGADELLVDLVAGLCSELFAVQMRALATGSDGLGQVAPGDILDIVLPKVTTTKERSRISVLIEELMDASVNFGHAVRSVTSPNWIHPPQRKSHCTLV